MTRPHRPRLRPVRVSRTHPRLLPFLIASFLIVGSLVLGVVSVQALASQGSFRMQELSRRNTELADANGRLQLRIAELSAPRRVERQARKLGFILPDPDQVQTIVVDQRP
jgi:cell division protein FtsL